MASDAKGHNLYRLDPSLSRSEITLLNRLGHGRSNSVEIDIGRASQQRRFVENPNSPIAALGSIGTSSVPLICIFDNVEPLSLGLAESFPAGRSMARTETVILV